MDLNRLTARTVQALKAKGRYADGGNLYLSIGNGGRSWVFLYRDRVTGRLREMGLGPSSVVSLQDARQRSATARKLLHDGLDPIADKRARQATASKAKTFGEFSDDFVESILPTFKNPKHKYQWTATLKKYAAPLRPMLLNAVTTDDVRKVLEPIWHTKNETAKRLRSRIERVFSAAKASGLRDGENPARWRDGLQPHFGKQKKRPKHLPALPYKEMPTFIADLRKRSGMSALALEFTILTAARTSETILAPWREFDLENALWTRPAERMKGAVEHRVPLTDRAVAILRGLKRGKPTEYAFEGAKPGKPLSDMAMLECLRDLRENVTVHGFRSSFRDWAGDETAFPRELAEMALAHINEDKVEAAYRRSDALKRRCELMKSWERFLLRRCSERCVYRPCSRLALQTQR